MSDLAVLGMSAFPAARPQAATSLRQPAVQDRTDEIPVGQVCVNPEQPRRLFDEQEMAELTESVRQHGVLIPILVERDPAGGYILHDGERRWRAAQAAGRTSIPARVLPPGADCAKLVHALVSNLHSASMSIVEEALAYRRLGKVYGYGTGRGSGEKIARLLGVSPVRVYNALCVLSLAPAIQEHFAARKLPNAADAVRALLHIPDEEVRLRLADRLASLPHPPTIQIVKAACTRLVNALDAAESALPDRSDEKGTPALRFSGQKPRAEWPEWEALYTLGKVPPWPVVNDAVMATCDACGLRPAASESTCRECPLVDCLRRMMRAVDQ